MRVFDYIQDEVRNVIDIDKTDKGWTLTYENEVVKRKMFEFRILESKDKVYECIKGFSIETCDDNGFLIENADTVIEENVSLWITPEEPNYRFIGGEIRLENNVYGWIEITEEHLKEYFKEIK